MTGFLQLTRSRLRRKILSYFHTNPSACHYLREVAFILKEDPSNLSKELSKLVKEGVFISSSRGNQKYFSLNVKYPLYKELKSIIFKTTGVEGSLRKMVNKIEGVKIAFIYGSFADNREAASSDIDLMIVGDPDEDRLIEDVESLEKALQREINYNIYSADEYKRKIKSGDSFMKNIFKRPIIVLRGDPRGI